MGPSLIHLRAPPAETPKPGMYMKTRNMTAATSIGYAILRYAPYGTFVATMKKASPATANVRCFLTKKYLSSNLFMAIM